MRYIPIEQILRQIALTEGGNKTLRRLRGAHTKLARMKPSKRRGYLERNGSRKWLLIKNQLTELLGNKCWYTEVEVTGAPLTIDHYRPQCDYWFLALDAMNYRVACPFANSPKHNVLYGCAGGKGDAFPLLGALGRSTSKNKLRLEKPLILDPCSVDDCNLLVFQETGRPQLHPDFSGDPIAVERVQKSLIILNIDHPDFNSKREQLYHDICDDVKAFEELPAGSSSRDDIHKRMQRRLSSKAAFSIAAKQYLQRFRYLDWVEDILAR